MGTYVPRNEWSSDERSVVRLKEQPIPPRFGHVVAYHNGTSPLRVKKLRRQKLFATQWLLKTNAVDRNIESTYFTLSVRIMLLNCDIFLHIWHFVITNVSSNHQIRQSFCEPGLLIICQAGTLKLFVRECSYVLSMFWLQYRKHTFGTISHQLF